MKRGRVIPHGREPRVSSRRLSLFSAACPGHGFNGAAARESLLIIIFNPFPCTSLGLLTTPRPIDHAEDFPILDKNNICGKTPYFAQNRLRESAAMPREART